MKTKLPTNRGAAMLIFVLFFAFATSSTMFVLGQSIFSDLSDFNRLTEGKRSFLVSESLTEDVVYRRVFGTFSIDNTENLTIDSIPAVSVTTYDSPNDIFEIETSAQLGSVVRKSYATMSIGAGTAFSYGLQAGNGGVELFNSASVSGNVYANGPVIGVAGGGGSDISGDVVSAGPAGRVADIHATGTVYAHIINDIHADVDAYYETASGVNIIDGTGYYEPTDKPLLSLPLDAATIQEWKDSITTTIEWDDTACDGGVYEPADGITIGYLKVECDLKIEGPGVTVNIDGPVWVEGNIEFYKATIQVDPALGRKSVQFIADNQANRLTSSQIIIKNSNVFNGSGDDRSFIMLMSLNNSASLGDGEEAIGLRNSPSGSLVLYAGEGLVNLEQSADLTAITAHTIKAYNSTQIVYKTGLASLLFTSGPGGAYILDDWQQAE